MPLISSPPTYPPSSSPAVGPESRKRPLSELKNAPAKRRLLQSNVALPQKNQAVDGRRSPSKGFITPHQPPPESVETVSPFVEEEADTDAANPDGVASQESTTSDPLFEDVQPQGLTYPTELGAARARISCESSAGKKHVIRKKAPAAPVSYERIAASRSKTAAPGNATRNYYGVDIHKILEDIGKLPDKPVSSGPPTSDRPPVTSVEPPPPKGKRGMLMWTEKYRARKFTDLVGDERTHRSVLGWVKGWDPIVFPGSSRPKPKVSKDGEEMEERRHKKILLLTGPPGLGKTTLAHVCARQAGYEVVEINASDERSKDVVKGKIRDCLGTENVRGVNSKVGDQPARRPGRPVCVVVDEVDGVVGGGHGGGEGGFMKALIDLVLLDQKNSSNPASTNAKRKGKGDNFRLLRPLILICNDLYHPSLRPLRTSGLAEIIHLRRPPLDKVVGRVRTVFEKEGFRADSDGIRRLCEATWGVSSHKGDRKASNTCEGDLRGILVVAEGIASRLRSNGSTGGLPPRVTKQWVEKHLVNDLTCGGSGDRGTGRGSVRDAVERVFLEGAGFPQSLSPQLPQEHWTETTAKSHASVSDVARGHALARLRHVLDTCAEHDRIVTDVFAAYPARPFHDDDLLSKPNAAHEWLHFYDQLASRVFAGAEWELAPYLSQPTLGFHHLFATSARSSWTTDADPRAPTRAGGAHGDDDEEPLPFTGPRADFAAHEALKANRASLQALQAALSLPLQQTFRAPEALATDLLPHLTRMLSPAVKPTVVGGSGDQRGIASVRRQSEKDMVRRAAEAMAAVGVSFERARIEDARGGYGGFVYRMEPYVQTLSSLPEAVDGLLTRASQTAGRAGHLRDRDRGLGDRTGGSLRRAPGARPGAAETARSAGRRCAAGSFGSWRAQPRPA